MIFSFKELKRMSNLPKSLKLEDVIEVISSIGFEVEGTKKFGELIKGIKFGKILKVYKNPNANKLIVCEVKFLDKVRIIQTNADNVKENMIVVGFIPGSSFKDIVFEEKELKGIKSEGMLSSPNEFGISLDLLRDGAADKIQSYNGYNINQDPIEALQLDDDLIDVDILTNRSDANSYFVMANELAAYFGTKMINIIQKKPNLDTSISIKDGFHKELVIIEANGNVNVSMKDQIFLTKHGFKTINNTIDLTNLTLLMTGQPTHVYDKTKVGVKFSTKYSSSKVTILGNKEVELKDNLVITSNDKIVSLAGVMGFENTSVSNNTKEFVFEFGQFDIKDIRSSLKTIKTNTNSGIQSSKKLAKGTLEFAIKYLTSKLDNFSNVINFTSKEKIEVEYSDLDLNRISGFKITETSKFLKVKNSLENLGYEFKKDLILVPNYRHDVKTQQDINEEILRFYGYDNIPKSQPKTTFTKVSNKKILKDKIAAMGYFETFTYSLISEEKNIFNPFNFDKSIKLETFVSKEREVIRNSQIHSLLNVFEYNNKRNASEIEIFSEGMINDGFKSIALLTNVKDFNSFKKDVVKILSNNIYFTKTTDKMMHPNFAADIFRNELKIGTIGKVHPKFESNDLLVAEILLVNEKKDKIKFKKYDNFPLKYRDITFELSEKESINEFIKDIKCLNKKIVDVFKKDEIVKKTVRFYGTNDQIKEIDTKFN